MHVPDGYLSPSTCAVLFAAATPFWAYAMRRMRELLLTRFVPLLSLFAAFSFVVMMFNIPLPGGTTGHAVGVTIATIVLGPWASILAISVALIIQALLFGDGGITAIGANCLNIAVAGSLVAHVVYRIGSGNAAMQSRRRVIAAGVAGYAAVNVAALLTAIEFGIQPMFFTDATGAPLYAPYPLSIAIPAMMIGHLTVAGIAEFILSAGLVAWLQRSEPSLLALSAPGAERSSSRPAQSRLRPLWIGLCALMLLTPLGLVATGVAWGEWSANDFSDPASRAAIARASSDVAPPPVVPAGLERLSTIWTAPLSDYAPPFMRHEMFGYMLSAVFGVGLILLAFLFIQLLAARAERRNVVSA